MVGLDSVSVKNKFFRKIGQSSTTATTAATTTKRS